MSTGGQEGCEVDVDSIYHTEITCRPCLPSIPDQLDDGEWRLGKLYMQWPEESEAGEPESATITPPEALVYAREKEGRTGLGVIPTIKRIGNILSQHEGNRFAKDEKIYTVQDLKDRPVQISTAAAHLYERVCESILEGRNTYSSRCSLQGTGSFIFDFTREPTQIPAGPRRVHLPDNRASFSWCTTDRPTAPTLQTSSRAQYSMPIPAQLSQSNATRNLSDGGTEGIIGSPSHPATGSAHSGEDEMPGSPMASFTFYRSNAPSPDSLCNGNMVSPDDSTHGCDQTVFETRTGRRAPLGELGYEKLPSWLASPDSHTLPHRFNQVYVSRDEDESARLGIMPSPEAISVTMNGRLDRDSQVIITTRYLGPGSVASHLAPSPSIAPMSRAPSGPTSSNVILPPRPRVVQPPRILGRRPGRPRHDTEGNTSTVTQSDNLQGSGTGLDPGYPWADEEILQLNFWDGPDDFLV